jgi:hypothetical protein
MGDRIPVVYPGELRLTGLAHLLHEWGQPRGELPLQNPGQLPL